ncbi:oligosaccharide flippase family protein [Pseudomonadales bacterium]|jgi:O-antigen/teichoic acid export membrane protein|nr:oligosaccharide flippase family protein [Pseudomonadales bacterium]MDC0893915.1 oligosaccharide flippase family protein [Pseudomonadales bacterium]
MSDLTGKSQLAQNIIVSWLVQILILVAGLIIPRQINDNLGSVSLGIWDLGWATFRYLTLLNIAAGSSLSRYFAFYRSNDNLEKLRCSVSVFCILQLISSAIVLLFTTIISISADLNTKSSPEAHFLVLVFGLALAIKFVGNTAGGVITGSHRFDLQHSINAIQDIGIALGVVVVLALGGDIIDLSYVVLGATMLTVTSRIIVAKRICPGVSLLPKVWETDVAKDMLIFGLKAIINTAPRVLTFQTASLSVAFILGPASLAILSRSISLLHICEQMINKISGMFVPMSGSISNIEDRDELIQLVLDSFKIGMALVSPLLIGLAAFGNTVIDLWMGPGFYQPDVLLTLLIGSALPLANSIPASILVGLNAHGRLGIVSLVLTFLLLIVGYLAVYQFYEFTIFSHVLIVAVVWTISRGFTVPYFIRKEFGVSYISYFWQGIILPLSLNIPLLVLLFATNNYLSAGQFIFAIGSFASAGVITSILYWRFILPGFIKQGMVNVLAIRPHR